MTNEKKEPETSACHIAQHCVQQVGHKGVCSPWFGRPHGSLKHLKEEDRKIFEHPADDDWEES